MKIVMEVEGPYPKSIIHRRSGKQAERSDKDIVDKPTWYTEQLELIHEFWLQLVPQSLENKLFFLFRDQMSYEVQVLFF